MLKTKIEIDSAVNFFKSLSYVNDSEHDKINEQIKVSISKENIQDHTVLLRDLSNKNQSLNLNLVYNGWYETKSSIKICFDYD